MITLGSSQRLLSGSNGSVAKTSNPAPAIDLVENKFKFLRYVERTENIQILKLPAKFGRK